MFRIIGIVLLLVLFGLEAVAVPELRIAAIETRNPQGVFRSSLSAENLQSIHVWVQNLPLGEPCPSAVVVMDINEAETGEGLIAEQAASKEKAIEPGIQSDFVFFQSKKTGTGLFKLISTAEGVYRISATVQCKTEPLHARSFIFSLLSGQKLEIPESPLWLGALIGIAVSLFLWPKKTEAFFPGSRFSRSEKGPIFAQGKNRVFPAREKKLKSKIKNKESA